MKSAVFRNLNLELIALIPAYRPQSNLTSIVQSILNSNFSNVVVVNDGSESEYFKIFDSLSRIDNVKVIHHAVNLGKGAALKAGFNHICNKWADKAYIVTIDADGQHEVGDIKNVAEELKRNSNSLIMGSRSFSGKVPFKSKIGNTLTRYLLKTVHGLDLSDTQTGLRGMTSQLAKNFLSIRSDRYDFELDMLLYTKKLNTSLIEVPIETVYIDNNSSTHFNPIFDSLKIYFSLFRFLMTSLVAALLDNLIFILLFSLGNSILVSQLAGRGIVMVINFVMVKRLVFHSNKKNIIAIPKYILTVIFLGTLSYGLIIISSQVFEVPVILAKIIVETVVFICSFLVQRSLVFNPVRI